MINGKMFFFIVDDEPYFNKSIKRCITSLWNEAVIEEKQTGKEAYEFILEHSNEIDMIVLDMAMPYEETDTSSSFGGHKTLLKIRGNIETDDIPILIFTVVSQGLLPNIDLNHKTKYLTKNTPLSKVKISIKSLLSTSKI